MNSELRKAIEEATRVEFKPQGRYILPEDHNDSQAKLLRVIELLIEQRDPLIVHAHEDDATKGEIKAYRDKLNAELIAALEKKK